MGSAVFGCLILCVAFAGEVEFLTGQNSPDELILAGRMQQWSGLGPSLRLVERRADLAEDRDLPQLAALAPRSAGVWIDAALAKERNADLASAEADLLHAARIDRSLLPAWTLTNFYFRWSRETDFWQWAYISASRTYDDFRPLLRLCDAMADGPEDLLSRLPVLDGKVARAYLDVVIGKGDLAKAEHVSRWMLARRDQRDRDRLIDLADRELRAERWEPALFLWNQFRPRAVLSNSDFRRAPTGIGFDWRIEQVSGVISHWDQGRLNFDFSGMQLENIVLLEQYFPVESGNSYRVTADQVQKQVAGDSPQWEINGKPGPLQATKTGVAKLRWVYRRELGSVPLHGEIQLRKIRLDVF